MCKNGLLKKGLIFLVVFFMGNADMIFSMSDDDKRNSGGASIERGYCSDGDLEEEKSRRFKNKTQNLARIYDDFINEVKEITPNSPDDIAFVDEEPNKQNVFDEQKNILGLIPFIFSRKLMAEEFGYDVNNEQRYFNKSLELMRSACRNFPPGRHSSVDKTVLMENQLNLVIKFISFWITEREFDFQDIFLCNLLEFYEFNVFRNYFLKEDDAFHVSAYPAFNVRNLPGKAIDGFQTDSFPSERFEKYLGKKTTKKIKMRFRDRNQIRLKVSVPEFLEDSDDLGQTIKLKPRKNSVIAPSLIKQKFKEEEFQVPMLKQKKKPKVEHGVMCEVCLRSADELKNDVDLLEQTMVFAPKYNKKVYWKDQIVTKSPCCGDKGFRYCNGCLQDWLEKKDGRCPRNCGHELEYFSEDGEEAVLRVKICPPGCVKNH
jgi:hypothetical protein